MTEYTIKCKENPSDTISASAEPADGDVAFIVRNAGGFRQSVYTSPADARTFARGILAMADEVDGGEVAEMKPADEPIIDTSKIVVLDNSAPTRAELLSQARDLMAGEDFTAHDLIALADYLAGESA